MRVESVSPFGWSPEGLSYCYVAENPYICFDKSEFIGVIQALAFLMECQGFAVKREQIAGEARKVQANSFKFINQIVRKILSL